MYRSETSVPREGWDGRREGEVKSTSFKSPFWNKLKIWRIVWIISKMMRMMMSRVKWKISGNVRRSAQTGQQLEQGEKKGRRLLYIATYGKGFSLKMLHFLQNWNKSGRIQSNLGFSWSAGVFFGVLGTRVRRVSGQELKAKYFSWCACSTECKKTCLLERGREDKGGVEGGWVSISRYWLVVTFLATLLVGGQE